MMSTVTSDTMKLSSDTLSKPNQRSKRGTRYLHHRAENYAVFFGNIKGSLIMPRLFVGYVIPA